MKQIPCILFFIGLCLNAHSQTTETSKIGYYARGSAGILTGETSSISFQMSNGISIGHVDLGLGIGLEVHDQSGYAPILLESRYNFGKGTTQPFVGIFGGYLSAMNSYYTYNGGYTVGATAGIAHYFSKHIGITTAIGYRYSRTSNDFPAWNHTHEWYYYGQNVIHDRNRLELRVGLVIH